MVACVEPRSRIYYNQAVALKNTQITRAPLAISLDTKTLVWIMYALSLSFKREGPGSFPSPDNCFQTSHSSLYKWKINGPFHPLTHNAVTGYKIMRAASSRAHFSSLLSRPHPL